MNKLPKTKNATPVMALLSVVMIVNALSYGTIIPLLYPYAARFGINVFALGFLFASFSIAQFIATPIIGRLSDRYGRKPLLLISLFGTGASMTLFALAWSAPILFIARILDGITGGNMTVAQAIIADIYPPEKRAKGFGILGASFGFGFLIGPALGAGLSLIHITAPFWFSAVLAFIASGIGFFVLPETLSQKNRKLVHNEPLFPFKKMTGAFFLPIVGPLFLLSLLVNTAHSTIIVGFQTVMVDILKLSTTYIGFLYSGVGLFSMFAQGYGVHFLLKKGVSKINLMFLSLILLIVDLLFLSILPGLREFTVAMLLYPVVFAPLTIIITQLISQASHGEDQGGMLGLNQSFSSIGQMVGPSIAGAIALWFGVWSVFAVTGMLFFFGLLVLIQNRTRIDSTKPVVDL